MSEISAFTFGGQEYNGSKYYLIIDEELNEENNNKLCMKVNFALKLQELVKERIKESHGLFGITELQSLVEESEK